MISDSNLVAVGATGENAVRLLDAKKLMFGSSILSLFDPYLQRGTGVVQEIKSEWLDLAFADATKIEEVVDAALKAQPLLERSDFQSFIEGRARS